MLRIARIDPYPPRYDLRRGFSINITDGIGLFYSIRYNSLKESLIKYRYKSSEIHTQCALNGYHPNDEQTVEVNMEEAKKHSNYEHTVEVNMEETKKHLNEAVCEHGDINQLHMHPIMTLKTLQCNLNTDLLTQYTNDKSKILGLDSKVILSYGISGISIIL